MLTDNIWPLLQFLIGLGIVVIVHEFGHFMAAKWAGIKVEEFAVGFGKKLWGLQRGETLYRINAVPLGGYVKMLGQDDLNPGASAPDDPRSWQAAPARKKMVVLAAGVAMNIVFALVVFVIVYLVGIRFQAPVIGQVLPGNPAARAGLQPGDEIQAVNGKPIRKFAQIVMMAALSGKDQQFDFQVARKENGQEKILHVQLVPEKLDTGKQGSHYDFGILAASSLTIAKPDDTGYVGKERFQKGDAIVAIDGTPVNAYWELDGLLPKYAGQNVPVVVERGGQRVTVETSPPALANDASDELPPTSQAATQPSDTRKQEMLTILGMNSLMRIGSVSPKTTAGKAGLQPGDIIVRYGTTDYPSYFELTQINKQSVDKPVAIQVLRDGKPVDATVTPQQVGERSIIGIGPGPAQELPIVASVMPSSPAADAGIVKGAQLVAVDGTAVSNWSKVYALLAAKQGSQAKLTFKVKDSETAVTVNVPKDSLSPHDYLFGLAALGEMQPLLTAPVRGNPLKAIVWSVEDTRDWMLQSYQTLARIFEGRVSAKEVAGPVGIGQIAISFARKSPIDFVNFMAMLSAMLAVMNFLPWPALDGGHFVIVLIEKARGKPLSTKLMTGIQMAGIMVLLGVFLMVTFNDILRLIRS